MTTANGSVASLSNADLLSATRQLVTTSHILEADLLAHLGEIDERKLYLDHAYASMFAFCVDELGFSEDAAYNRILVARASRRLPAIVEALRSGSVHLAGLRLLAPHLTELNCELVLPQAAGKSKRDIEELVARLAPSPPVRTAIRRVPECAVASWSPTPTQLAPGTPIPPSTPDATSFCFAAAVQAASAAPDSVAPPCSSADPSSTAAPAQTFVGRLVAPRGASRSVVAPLSGETFQVTFTASRQLRDKLFGARALLRHRVPDGDVPTIIEKALDALIEKVEKERFGRGRKARAAQRPPSSNPAPLAPLDASSPSEVREPPAAPAASAVSATGDVPSMSPAPPTSTDPAPEISPTASAPGTAPSRRIPDAIKRAVYERDGGRCTYTDERGRMCGSTEALTFDHEFGFARTHEHSVDGIRLRCAAHNQHEADKMYGREFMERARRKAASASDAQGSAPRPAENSSTEVATEPGSTNPQQLVPGQVEASGEAPGADTR